MSPDRRLGRSILVLVGGRIRVGLNGAEDVVDGVGLPLLRGSPQPSPVRHGVPRERAVDKAPCSY